MKSRATAAPIEGTQRTVERMEATCATEGCWKTIYCYVVAGEAFKTWYHDDTSRTTCVVRVERRGRHAPSEKTPRI